MHVSSNLKNKEWESFDLSDVHYTAFKFFYLTQSKAN